MKKQNLALLAAAAMLLALLSGCAAGAAEAAAEGALTVTDMLGRTVTLAAPARRVAALSAGDCEILFDVGAGDALVGRGEFCDYPEEALAAPSVKSGSEVNIEELIALEPELVIMSVLDHNEDKAAQLEAAGIAVAVSDADDVAGIYEAISMIGALTGREDGAAEATAQMQAQLAALKGEETGKTIYFEVSPLEYGLWTAGTGTFMDEAAALLGLTNCFADVESWGEISQEQVIERNPDYIVTVTMFAGDGMTPSEEIMSRKGWENVTAVKNGAILNLQDNELSRPAPRLVEGFKLLSDFALGK